MCWCLRTKPLMLLMCSRTSGSRGGVNEDEGLILDTVQHNAECHGKLEEGFLMRRWLMLLTGFVDRRKKFGNCRIFPQTTAGQKVEKKAQRTGFFFNSGPQLMKVLGWGDNEWTTDTWKGFNNPWPRRSPWTWRYRCEKELLKSLG